MAPPRTKPAEFYSNPGDVTTRRRTIRKARTNALCPYRSRCLDLAGDLPVLDCRGCVHVADTEPWERLYPDLDGCIELLLAAYIDP